MTRRRSPGTCTPRAINIIIPSPGGEPDGCRARLDRPLITPQTDTLKDSDQSRKKRSGLFEGDDDF
jgi:hypothetical protein